MANAALLKKLLIKPNQRVLVLNAPEGYIEMLQPLPEGAVLAQQAGDGFDVVLSFLKNKAEVDELAPEALNSVKPGGVLWLAYPKKTSKIKTDIHRDAGWEKVVEAGWGGVSLVALDDTWSAMRYRPFKEINFTPGSQRYKEPGKEG